jgi:uncharacterized membrane protein YgdD (TMEM256/DUF423 family)
MTWTLCSFFGALLSALAVLAGAFGAHAVQSRLSEQMLKTFETAVRYHFYHALGLLAVAFILSRADTIGIRVSAWLMLLGTLGFSGSLYVYCFTDERIYAYITPIGGVILVAAWLTLAVSLLRL